MHELHLALFKEVFLNKQLLIDMRHNIAFDDVEGPNKPKHI